MHACELGCFPSLAQRSCVATSLPLMPGCPSAVLGVSEAFKRETSPDKLNLGVRLAVWRLSIFASESCHGYRSQATPLPCRLDAQVGAYRTEDLKPYVLKVVKKVSLPDVLGPCS